MCKGSFWRSHVTLSVRGAIFGPHLRPPGRACAAGCAAAGTALRRPCGTPARPAAAAARRRCALPSGRRADPPPDQTRGAPPLPRCPSGLLSEGYPQWERRDMPPAATPPAFCKTFLRPAPFTSLQIIRFPWTQAIACLAMRLLETADQSVIACDISVKCC